VHSLILKCSDTVNAVAIADQAFTLTLGTTVVVPPVVASTLVYCIEGEFKDDKSVFVESELDLEMKPSIECNTYLLSYLLSSGDELPEFMYFFYNTLRISPQFEEHVGVYTIVCYAQDENGVVYEVDSFKVTVLSQEILLAQLEEYESSVDVIFESMEVDEQGLVTFFFSDQMQVYQNFTEINSF